MNNQVKKILLRIILNNLDDMKEGITFDFYL